MHRFLNFGAPILGSLVAFCLAAPHASGAGAQKSSDENGRKVIEEFDPPWSAVGQVNIAGYRRRAECTGSLIANDVVITAAHCVWDPSKGRPFPNHQIHFLAGVRGSKWLGHSVAKCLHFDPEYAYDDKAAIWRDVVLITLQDSLDQIPPAELDRTPPRDAGVSLVHAAYPNARRYVLTAQFGCRLIASDGKLWLTDCDARPGGSGGPVFVQKNDGLRLAAVMVGRSPSGSVAVPIANWLDIATAATCP